MELATEVGPANDKRPNASRRPRAGVHQDAGDLHGRVYRTLLWEEDRRAVDPPDHLPHVDLRV